MFCLSQRTESHSSYIWLASLTAKLFFTWIILKLSCVVLKKRAGGLKHPSDEVSLDKDISEEANSVGEEARETPDISLASKRALESFLRKKAEQEALILQSAKSFAKAGVPVLTLRSELCDDTFLSAARCFLDRFMSYRRSLLLRPQCIPIPKASRGLTPVLPA